MSGGSTESPHCASSAGFFVSIPSRPMPSHASASTISAASSSCTDNISIPTGSPIRLTPQGNVMAGRPLMAAVPAHSLAASSPYFLVIVVRWDTQIRRCAAPPPPGKGSAATGAESDAPPTRAGFSACYSPASDVETAQTPAGKRRSPQCSSVRRERQAVVC